MLLFCFKIFWQRQTKYEINKLKKRNKIKKGMKGKKRKERRKVRVER